MSQNYEFEIRPWKYKVKIKDFKRKTKNKQTNKKKGLMKTEVKREIPVLFPEYLRVKMKPQIFPPRIFCPLKFKWRWNILAACVYLWVKLASVLFLSTVFVFACMDIGGICCGTNENRDLVSQDFAFCSECVCLWSVIPQNNKFLLSRIDPTVFGLCCFNTLFFKDISRKDPFEEK